jgi:hypothetical protein
VRPVTFLSVIYTDLPPAGRRMLQGGGDLQAVPIDVQRGLLGAERFKDAIIVYAGALKL